MTTTNGTQEPSHAPDRLPSAQGYRICAEVLTSHFHLTEARRCEIAETAGPAFADDCANLFSRNVDILNVRTFSASLAEDERRHFDGFRAHVLDHESISTWTDSATKLGAILAPGAFDAGFALARHSLITDNLVNFLFFDNDDDPFIILQLVTFADAVFFPRRGVAVVLQHVTDEIFRRSCAQAVRWFLERGGEVRPAPTFGGAIAGIPRPYHFFYDTVPAMEILHASGSLTRIPRIFTDRAAWFCDWSDLYEAAPEVEIGTPQGLRDRARDLGEFHIRVGAPFPRLPESLNRSVERRVREAAMRKYPDDAPGGRRHQLRLWIGVSGEKRSWVEQEDGIVYILETLLREVRDLAVVFDGWTCPTHPGPKDLEAVEGDKAIVARILGRVEARDRLTHISVIGRTPLEKIAVGMTCDAFVASYGTGSMHVSRFAERPGVLHINTTFLKSHHVHHRAVSVPADRVTDLPEDAGKHRSFVSYSIRPDDVLFLLRSVLQTHAVAKLAG